MSRSIFVLYVLIVLQVVCSWAQQAVTFIPVRTYADGTDSVKSRIAIIDNSFQHVKGRTLPFIVRDNASRPTIVQTLDQPQNEQELSLLIAVDLSNSMSVATPVTNNISPLAITIQAVQIVRGLMTRSLDELGLVGIASRSELFYALSTDKSRFRQAVDSLRSQGSRNLQRGLLDSPTGALSHLQNSRNSKALILFTDGNSRFDAKTALATAKTFDIKVYVVGIRTNLSKDLRLLADSSGGAFVENVLNASEASSWACAYVVDAKRLGMTTLSWALPQECDSVRTFSIADGRSTRTGLYRYPDSRVSRLVADSTGIDYGLVVSGNASIRQVAVSAINLPVTITSVRLTPGVGFSISEPPILPLTLLPGKTLSLNVTYTAQSTNAVYAVLHFDSDACVADSVILRAGSLFTGQTVQLVRPNGGETFIAGRDTVVQWTNALPEDYMRLEISTNMGASWSTITESAQGLSHRWSPGTGFGKECLLRITGTVIDQRSILRLRGQSQPVYSAIFTPDDRYVITGGDDGTVRTWDASTGQQSRVIGIHGNWVWALAIMPGTTFVASASHDGTVRVWDYRTSARIATMNLGSRVWSVAFSSDGKTLYAGTERALAKVSTDTWTIEQLFAVQEGPVYDVHVPNSETFILTAEGSIAVARASGDLSPLQSFQDPTQTGSVYAVTMPSTDDVVLTGGADFILRKYRFSDGQLQSSSSSGVGSILGLSYSSDDLSILSAGGDATAKIHNPEDLSVRVSLAGHEGIVYGASFSSDDSSVVTASTDFTARIWPLSKLGTVSDQTDAPFTIEGGRTEVATVSFGDVFIGSGSDVSASLLRNISDGPVIVRSVRLLNTNQSADFDASLPMFPVSLAPGQELNLGIQFVPRDVGMRTATVEVVTGIGLHRISLSGRGVLPALQVREVLDFGRHVANQAVIDSSITITANGDPNTSFDVTLTTITGEQSSMFSIVGGAAPFRIRGGEAQKISLRFDPQTFGRFAAYLVIRINGQPTQLVRLYGEATGEGRLSSSSAVLFASNTCEPVSSDRSIMIRNSGNAQTTIYSIALEGADADEFALNIPRPFPITIAGRDSMPIGVTFAPRRVGIKDIRVVIFSDASNTLNGRTVVNMSARRDSVGFELSRSSIVFDNVADGDMLSDRLQIINTGTITLQWPRGVINLGRFRIDSIVPDVTPGGRSSAMIVTFLGGEPGRTYDTSYTFVDSICGRRQTLSLKASVKSIIGARVRIGSISAGTGQLVSVPVYVTKKVNLDRTIVRDIVLHLSVNGTILTPTGPTPVGVLNPDGRRRFSVAVPLNSNDSLAATLTLQTTWGNDTTSVIRIDSVTVADTLTFQKVDGEVRINDLCRIGGRARLISIRQNGAGIEVIPKPATSTATITMDVIERGQTRVSLFDNGSRLISTLHDGLTAPGKWIIPMNISDLPAGVYFLVMTTPSETFTQRVEVVR